MVTTSYWQWQHSSWGSHKVEPHASWPPGPSRGPSAKNAPRCVAAGGAAGYASFPPHPPLIPTAIKLWIHMGVGRRPRGLHPLLGFAKAQRSLAKGNTSSPRSGFIGLQISNIKVGIIICYKSSQIKYHKRKEEGMG